MLVHRGPKKRPAASIWPCLPAATTLPATPQRRLVDPEDSGTTRQSRRVGGLAAELEVGCGEEGNPPPCVASEAARRKKVPKP